MKSERFYSNAGVWKTGYISITSGTANHICFPERHGDKGRSVTAPAIFPRIIKGCTPHRPFDKWYTGAKRTRLCADHFRISVKPVIVKQYRKILVNKGFCKKKMDTRFDTHCIKVRVQKWHCILADAICDRIVHDSYSVLVEGRESMCKRKGIVEDA